MPTSLEQLQLDIDRSKEDLDSFLGDKTEQVLPKKKKKDKEKKKEKKKSSSKSKLSILATASHDLSSSDEDSNRVEILQDEDYEDF